VTVGRPAPLRGVRVVEFGNLIAAPHAAMMLADLGADVVKVEPPGGDLGRGFGPYRNGESVFFLSANRGKRSMVLDLATETGVEAARELCATADVVVHNLRKGAMERRGLGYEDLAAGNPGLVYAAVSAFGWTGPESDRAGIDVVFQGESGMMSITGDPDSPPGKTATTIGDYVAATNAALAVTAALVERAATGRGRRVDVSLRDGIIAVQGGWNALAFHAGTQPPKTGTASPFLAPNQAFPTADGHLTVAIVSDRHFRILCDALAHPDLAARYPTNEERLAGRDALAAELGTVFRTKSTDEWLAVLAPLGMPVGRVRSLPEVFADPQVRHNEMVVDLQHPALGTVAVTGSPLRFDGGQAMTTRPPPRLGEHTAEIFAELGLSSDA
jgi:crotonobetainyl-CoA:carnitine CoA-transferase CaiB-like acyl-CoA transferase